MKQTRPARRTAASVIGSAALSLALAGGLLVPAAQPASAAPTLRVQRVVGGLTIPWDVTWIGQTMLYNERPGRVWIKRPGAAPQRVNLALPRIWARSEGGLLGLVADPGAASNGYFYSCMTVAASATRPKDVEVWKWKLTSPTTATPRAPGPALITPAQAGPQWCLRSPNRYRCWRVGRGSVGPGSGGLRGGPARPGVPSGGCA